MLFSYVLANIIPKLFSIITLSIIINDLSLNQYSDFDFILISSGIIFPILSVCLIDGYYHFILKYKVDFLKDVIGFINATHFIIFFICLFFNLLYDDLLKYVFIILLSFAQVKLYLSKMICRVHEYKFRFIICELLPSMSILLSVYAFKYCEINNDDKLYIYLSIYSISWLISSYIIYNRYYFNFIFKLKRNVLEYSLPLIPNAVIALLAFNLFRYIDIGNASEVYVLNYRVLMFYIVINSISYMFLQDIKYKYRISDLKFIFVSILGISILFPIFYLCIDKIIPFYLDNKLNDFHKEVYNLSIFAMIIYMLSSVLSICINFRNRPMLILISNIISLFFIVSFVIFFDNSTKSYAYAMILGFTLSFIFRVAYLSRTLWNEHAV
ncbi:TPA: hypothetical protein ACX6S8_003700 [Photobacterium damselae]